MPTKLEHALALVKKGFKIFPVIENGKRPAIDDWQGQATNSEEMVQWWWEDRPDCNIGVVGHGVALIDIDMKDGDGLSEWAKLNRNGARVPMMVRTPSGGIHAYYMDPEGLCPTTVKWLGQNIDTRGAGGYVVGPGSTIDGQTYELVTPLEPLSLEPWMRERFAAKAAQRAAREARTGEYEGEWNSVSDCLEGARRCEWWLEHKGAPAPGDRDDKCYRLVTWVMDLPLTEDQVFELVQYHWGNAGEISDEMIWEKIKSALRNRDSDRGVDHVSTPSEEFEHLHRADADPWAPRSMAQMMELDRVKFWDEDRMIPNIPGVVMVYGPGGAHKTNILLTKCLDILAARDDARIAYSVQEGEAGIGARLRAQMRQRRLDKAFSTDRLAFYDVPKMMDEAVIGQMIQSLEKRQRPNILIFDTFATGLEGSDEDTVAAHLITAKGNLGKMARRLGTVILLVHHTGWDEKHMRGASGFYFNAEGILRCDANSKSAATHCKLNAERFRSAKDGHTIYYELQQLPDGLDANETVPVPIPCSELEYKFFSEGGKQPPLSYAQIFEALEKITIQGPVSTQKLAMALIPQPGHVAAERYAKIIERLGARLLKARELTSLRTPEGLWSTRDPEPRNDP